MGTPILNPGLAEKSLHSLSQVRAKLEKLWETLPSLKITANALENRPKWLFQKEAGSFPKTPIFEVVGCHDFCFSKSSAGRISGFGRLGGHFLGASSRNEAFPFFFWGGICRP